MNVLVTGATGFIGSHLTKHLEAAGHAVLAVSRRSGARYNWSDESLAQGVREADAVVHLAGENLVGKRWSASQKQVLQSSRFENTRKLAALVAARKPSVFVSASAVGYYGASTDAVFREDSPQGHDFLAELCGGWEAATATAANAGVRTAIIRIGVVLGPDGGALARMLLPFKLGLGGPVGDGKQWMSWIHVDDLASLFLFLIENPKARGVFNGTAPQPVTMREFAKALGSALHRPAFFPVPGFVLKLALGEVADVLLTGQNVQPTKAQEAGFKFRFTDVNAALRDVVG
jgi:uncharacterized protein (TIGR01777 family)